MENYKLAIREACTKIVEARHELFSSLVSVAKSGEYQELDEAFEEGDIFNFELAHFSESKDVNVQTLYELIQKLEETYVSLLNLNRMNSNDLGLDS